MVGEEQANQVRPTAAADFLSDYDSIWVSAMSDEGAVNRLVISDGDPVESPSDGHADHHVWGGPTVEGVVGVEV